MNVPIDSHSHSKYSHDGKEKAENLIKRASELGLEYYAITEHLDRDYKYCKAERFIPQLNLKKYYKAVGELREIYANSGVEHALMTLSIFLVEETKPLSR